MIDALEHIDRSIVYAVNQWNTPLLDEIMWVIAGKLTWVPLYLLLIWLAFRKMSRQGFVIFVLCAIFAVALADLLSVHLFKNMFQRYRPSHHGFLTNRLHFYELKPGEFYKGGMFGFVSSHATNFFALAIFTGIVLKDHYKYLFGILLGIAAIISFSRLYQGVHYLSDLLAGALLGTIISLLVYKFLYLHLAAKYK